ncbi:MAG: hypothetical protein ABIR91_02810 [Candidatus Saccharimonadales bacterium]
MVRYCQQFLSQLVDSIAGIAAVGCFTLVIAVVFSGLIHQIWPITVWGIVIVAFALVYTWLCVREVRRNCNIGPPQ